MHRCGRNSIEEAIRLGIGGGVVSGTTYNAEQSEKNELLVTCFQAPVDTV